MRKLIISLLVGLIASMALMAYADETQKGIASGVVRLHIIANSDSEADQCIKLKVRDAVINEFAPIFEDVQNSVEAKQVINANLDKIEDTANRVLSENDFGYDAQALCAKVHFPIKHYENITLPAGNYDALRIVLGTGSGQNWWCVMYPPLCFEYSTAGCADLSSTDTLKSNLGDDNYKLVSDDGSLPVQFKFKILEIFDSIYN